MATIDGDHSKSGVVKVGEGVHVAPVESLYRLRGHLDILPRHGAGASRSLRCRTQRAMACRLVMGVPYQARNAREAVRRLV